MNIIGLGKVGCNIADHFGNYPQYNIYKIDRNIEGKRCYSLPDLQEPEEYEEFNPKTGNFFKGLKGEVLFILSGASIVSGASLRLLQQIHNKNIPTTILYIEPEIELLSEKKQLQERVVRNVLQQYARSGLFKKMFMVQNQSIEKMLGDVPILKYFQSLNQFLVSTIHLLNVFENSESVTDTFSSQSDTARICTFGTIIDQKSETLFYPLDEVREIRYYFGVPKEVLENQSTLYRDIVNMVKSKISGKLRASYGIYETSYEEILTYGIYYSSQIQEKS